MPAVVVTAEVEDTKTWEERFRSHASLFKEYTVRKPVRFAIGEGNRVTICFEPEDLDTYMKSMESDATAEAMAHDGVKRETVQIQVLDKSVDL
jgi:hypothetical protein